MNLAIKYLLLLLFVATSAGSLFLTSTDFVNVQIAPKWYAALFGCCAGLLVYTVYSFRFPKTVQLQKATFPFCLTVVLLCLAQALYGIMQYAGIFSAENGFRLTGSFDNPAGFAAGLCAGFPFFFYFILKKQGWQRWLSIIAATTVCLAVALSASRAGILSLFAVIVFVVFYKLHLTAKLKILILSLAFISAISGLYFLKKDSADGRLLIWKCTLEMIKENPVKGLGYGKGGFKAHYMNYQARYFEEHPGSRYTMLADNVNHPFNEYLLLLVNYGLFGLIPLVLLLYRLGQIYIHNKHKTLLDYTAFGCLLSIAVFSFFSYPLTYPFVWIMGLSSIAILFHPLWRSQKKTLYALRPIIIPAVLLAGYMIYNRMTAEIKWNDIAHKSLRGLTAEMLPEYRLLYDKLRTNELFLYNYAAELNVVEQYERSLEIAHECERLWADYDLQMLMADNYRQLQQYEEAERHFRKMAAMCPAKFMPLYELAKLCEATGREAEALAMAEQIIAKKVKISSSTIAVIKREMQELVNRINNKCLIKKQRQEKTSEATPLEVLLPP
jgi:O-antigen ligase